MIYKGLRVVCLCAICGKKPPMLYYNHDEGRKAPTDTNEGGRNMEKGMNASELQELKEALLKAERLEMLAILRDAESVEDAIKAIEQRLKA